MCLLLSSLVRLSFMSVVFVFSKSLNDAAPLSPMQLRVDVNIRHPFPVDVRRKEKS